MFKCTKLKSVQITEHFCQGVFAARWSETLDRPCVDRIDGERAALHTYFKLPRLRTFAHSPAEFLRLRALKSRPSTSPSQEGGSLHAPVCCPERGRLKVSLAPPNSRVTYFREPQHTLASHRSKLSRAYPPRLVPAKGHGMATSVRARRPRPRELAQCPPGPAL